MRIESGAANLIAARAQLLATHAVDINAALLVWPALHGSALSRERCVEDATLHLRSLSDAILGASEQLFVDYVDWARTCLNARDIPEDYLTQQLTTLRTVLNDELPHAAREAESYLSAAFRKLDAPPTTEQPEVAPQTLAARYLERLLCYDRNGALGLIREALDQGTSLRDVYLEVVQKVQHEIGRLWQLNKITVAQEHYCTAVSQLALAQLYPEMMHSSGGQPMIATCVTDELHELGARMVADFFEMDGWDSTYVGANAPPHDVVKMLRKRDARLLAISATMGFHVHGVVELIRAVRDASDLAHVKILVGGRPFHVEGALWRHIGADGCADDAQQAVKMGRQLIGS